MLGDSISYATCGGRESCSHHDAQKDHLARIAIARQSAYGLYAMVDAAAFRHGELDKLVENDRQLADCRSRRKAAILRISRMIQE
jgi:hypothetical protein